MDYWSVGVSEYWRPAAAHVALPVPPSLGAHPQDLEDAFEFVVAEKGNLQGAFALGVAQMDLGSQPFAQLVFKVRQMGILRQVRQRAGFLEGPGLASLQTGHQ